MSKISELQKHDKDAGLKQRLSEANARVKALEGQLELATKQLESKNASRFKLSIGKSKGTKGTGFCRVVVPDSHGSAICKPAAKAFLTDLELIKPSEIVMLGDHVDCGGFLAQHHTLGYVAQADYSFVDDVTAANIFLDEIQAKAGGASIDYLEGNHERRIESWIVTQTLGKKKDAEFLKSCFSITSTLNLEKRGLRLIEQGKFYDKVQLPATIRKGNCYFTHGSSTAKHAASVHLNRFGGNVVFGHTHRRDSYFSKTVKEGSLGAWNPGCLSELQPLWQHTNPTDWSHGYGLQMVRSNGDFLHINVPIVNGKSLLNPLIEELK
jgi:predicted phosphodiesterase